MMQQVSLLLIFLLGLVGRASPFLVGQPSSRRLCHLSTVARPDHRQTTMGTVSAMMMLGPFDAATTLTLADGGEWRQYVPLVTSGLVLADMLAGAVTGNSVANSITRSMQQSVLDKEAADEDAAREARGLVRPDVDSTMRAETADESASSGKARVDTDGMREEALKRAEMAMLAVELRDERRGYAKGSVEDLKRKLDRELGE